MITWQTLARPKPCPYGSALYKRIIDSPLWVAQLKVDGWRVLVEMDRRGIATLTTRHGEILRSIPATFVEAVQACIPALSRLDCELERPWAKLWVIDVLTVAGRDVYQQPLSERLMRRDALLNGSQTIIGGVPTIKERKDDYYHAVLEAGGEGIVLKRLGDMYPTRGEVWLKVKPERA